MSGRLDKTGLDRLDLEIEARYGFHGSPARGPRGGPGLVAENWPQHRPGLVILTGLYFVSLCLGSGLLINLVVATIGYFVLTLPRWKEKGLTILCFPYLVVSFLIEHDGSLLTQPLILQFVLVMPLVLVCLMPPGQRLFAETRLGRAPFILCMVPSFVAIGMQYWPGLKQAMLQLWSLVGPPLDEVPATIGYILTFALIGFAMLRLHDMFAGGRKLDFASWTFIAIVVLRVFLADHAGWIPDYVPLVDLALVASILGLCLWPSRQPDVAAEPSAADRA